MPSGFGNDFGIEAGIVSLLRDGPVFELLFRAPGEPEAIARLIERGIVLRVYRGWLGLFGIARLELAPTRARQPAVAAIAGPFSASQ